ncbi:hypothetical protein NBRC10512_004034 [Rhodotorula toruloides]|uniref:RHTO0S03e08570g1_1 n=2 Tax=Rhodotorula toruloides TaxID=5286 RepID=A0A061ASK8_RHOTO|nr:uncharacterized protein RHTO_00412 [Rhodotorula toruloides NP11]EMS25984.1 hypothetical protein RHTO_00412 [Rhodotorula toruloides NP11]CDR38352.1 RHTO0S03e08570g1_1 [Rhodotorula toruloides]
MTTLPVLRRAPMNYSVAFVYHWSVLQNPVQPTHEAIGHLSACWRLAERIAEGATGEPNAQQYRDDCTDIHAALNDLLAQLQAEGGEAGGEGTLATLLTQMQQISESLQRIENEQAKLANYIRVRHHPQDAKLLPIRDSVNFALPPHTLDSLCAIHALQLDQLTACLEHYGLPPPESILSTEYQLEDAAKSLIAYVTGL